MPFLVLLRVLAAWYETVFVFRAVGEMKQGDGIAVALRVLLQTA